MDVRGTDLSSYPIHLGAGSTATFQPVFTGDPKWYADYAARVADDGTEGWLVSMYTFSTSWDIWEVHPDGHEIVVCLTGTIRIRQEHADGSADVVTLGPGQAAINPPGTWHTADVDAETMCLFVTAGAGTDHRPR